MNGKCYICSAPETSREHVPPRCFFEGTDKKNLTTVPSCEKHNNGNSDEVETVRNILSSHFNIDREIAKGPNDKAWRSFNKAPTKMERTFANIQPISFGGIDTAMYTLDIISFNKVMACVAGGIHFKLKNRPYFGSWDIFTPHAHTRDELTNGKPSAIQEIRNLVTKGIFISSDTSHPDVFSLGILEDDANKIIYEFTFFRGFKVYAFSIPPWRRHPRS